MGGFNGAKVTGVGLAGTLVGLTPVPVAGKVSVAVAAGNTVVEIPSAVVYIFQTFGAGSLTKKLCNVCELPKLSNTVTAVESL